MDEQAGSINKEIANAANQERRVMLFDLEVREGSGKLCPRRSLESVATACVEVS